MHCNTSKDIQSNEMQCNAPLAFVGQTTALGGGDANALGGATIFIANGVHCGR